MAFPSSQSRYQAAIDQAVVHAASVQTVSRELQTLAATREDRRTRAASKTPSAAPPSYLVPHSLPTVRNPANKLWAHKIQRDLFIQHLRTWASNHDTSPYFHGSISLPPQGTFPREIVELGKSIHCVLTSQSSRIQENIVVRLFRSHRDDDDARRRRVEEEKGSAVDLGTEDRDQTNKARGRREKTYAHQTMAPYHLVIRSGSGWVPARQYFNKHYFAHPRKPDPPQIPCKPTFAGLADGIPLSRWTHFANPITIAAVTIVSQSANTVIEINTNRQAGDVRASTQLRVQNSPLHRSRQNGPSPAAKDTVTISPLFHPFSRLPQELQDEILLQAVGYTRRISLTQIKRAKNGPKYNKAPISISKLFRISKTINRYMVPHIFGSTNFHFGTTGFTKLLWQIGPVNRASLRHLTFHFGKQSLLHCIRWTAPDPVYHLFEPGVATQPASLSYFWRCQLQDLMKELNLSTLTIDISGVPVADVPMLARILSTVVGSVERIQVVDKSGRRARLVDEYTEDVQDIRKRFPDLSKLTWRELCQRYYSDYRRCRWHMRDLWTMHDDGNLEVFGEWINKDSVFFDS